MSKSTDWLPNNRDGILAMADDWIAVCIGKKTAWNIPDPVMENLITLKGTVANALETAKKKPPVPP
jgi:hypothetical protein